MNKLLNNIKNSIQDKEISNIIDADYDILNMLYRFRVSIRDEENVFKAVRERISLPRIVVTDTLGDPFTLNNPHIIIRSIGRPPS